jgi:hypothetical protein
VRNRVAVVLLYLSWPVCLIHSCWNNWPLHPVRWIFLDKTVYQDFRWYLVYTELWLSATFVLLAALLWTHKTRTIRILLWANILISVIDLWNYWLFFRRQEWFLKAEFVVMLVATVLIFHHAFTTHKNEKTC